jgi:hypothetical protein
MAGRLQAVVADLTFDPDAAYVTLQHIADLAGELGDGQNLGVFRHDVPDVTH